MKMETEKLKKFAIKKNSELSELKKELKLANDRIIELVNENQKLRTPKDSIAAIINSKEYTDYFCANCENVLLRITKMEEERLHNI